MLTSMPMAGPCQRERLGRRLRLIIVATLWLLAIVIGGSSRADEPSPNSHKQTLRVRVRDLDLGAPVPGVALTLSAAGGTKLQTLTDADVLFGLSLDERPDDARSFVKRENLPWLQGFTDPDEPIVSAYGATSIPATFLIGPDGKILAREIRGERTKATVAEALKP